MAFSLARMAERCYSVMVLDGEPSTIASIFDFRWKC